MNFLTKDKVSHLKWPEFHQTQRWTQGVATVANATHKKSGIWILYIFFQLSIKIVNTSNLKIKVLYHPISLSPITLLSHTASVRRKVSIESFIMYRAEFYFRQPAKLFFCILFPYEIIARASLLKFHRAICKRYSCRGDFFATLQA